MPRARKAALQRSVRLDEAERALETFLRAIGAPVDDDPELRGTPRRVAEAYANELLSGYDDDPAAILADSTASSAKDLIVVRDLSIATMCPHHLLPATGIAHVGYLPGRRIVGLGALGKLVDAYSRRFALQEDLASNVANALIEYLGARGAACVIDLSPTCMTIRGDKRAHARAVSMAFRGALEKDLEKAAFLAALHKA